MNAVVSSVDGTLLPSSYVVSALTSDARELGCPPPPADIGRSLVDAWSRAQTACGPVSGLRALFDYVVEPIAMALGFHVGAPRFFPACGQADLRTPGGRHVALVLLPWASRPSLAWRDLSRLAAEIDAHWGFVVAPPFLSLVPVTGHATRHSIDLDLTHLTRGPVTDLVWTIARASAFDGPEPGDAVFIERLVGRAAVFQDGVRSDLQVGVTDALSALEPAVAASVRRGATPRGQRRTVDASRSSTDDALTLVYRILFLLFVEAREPESVANPVYARAYSVRRLACEAIDGRTTGSWDALAAITRLARLGCRAAVLDVPPFNGRLFARASAPSLEARSRGRRRAHRVRERDEAVGRALVALTSRRAQRGREIIDYRDLGVEQLGAVYERLLDVVVPGGTVARARRPARGHSHARKETGSFYTPRSLADFIVRRTLAPLVEGASADAILALRVVDPAMGSGACLVAACRYLASAYERAAIDEGRASSDDFDERERANTRRLVAERCLVGVDRNPTAVELARLSIWLTTLAHGKPLGFLDHRLRTGDSLIGAWPGDLARLGQRSTRTARHLPLLDLDDLVHAVRETARPLADLRERRDDSVEDVHAKASAWRQITSATSALEPWRRAATLWCARWFWPDADAGPPNAAEARALIDALLGRDRTLPPARVEARWRAAAAAAESNQFFHWPLEFPDAFFTDDGEPRERAGFDAVIGNPPWEMVRHDDRDSHASASSVVRYVRDSGQYPSCDRGHLNLYQAFLDRALALTRPGGRIGLVLPWSLATDDGASRLRARLLDECALDTLVGLDNARGLFPIHRGLRFAVVTATPGRHTSEIRARFGVTTTDEIDALSARDDASPSAYPVRLLPGVIARVGGPLRRIPDIRRPGDLDLLERLSAAFPPLGDGLGWGVTFGRELNATEARADFGTTGLPVIDGKHIAPFSVATTSSSRMSRAAALRLLPRAPFDRPRLAYRDVSGVANRYALIAAVVPTGVVTTHTLFCLKTVLNIERQHFLCAVFNSYVMNAMVRMLMGSHLTTSLIEGLPVPGWTGRDADRRMALAAVDLRREPQARKVSAWLQAAVARRYGLTASEFRHVLNGVPLVAREELDEVWAAFTAAERT